MLIQIFKLDKSKSCNELVHLFYKNNELTITTKVSTFNYIGDQAKWLYDNVLTHWKQGDEIVNMVEENPNDYTFTTDLNGDISYWDK